MCRFYDERLDAAQRLAWIHELMRGGMGEVQAFLARIEKLLAATGPAQRGTPAFRDAMARLSRDNGARSRFLAHARGLAAHDVRARMIALAGELGWLDAAGLRDERIALVAAMLRGRAPGFAEVDLACALNRDGALEAARHRLPVSGAQPLAAGEAAVLACLGDPAARAQALQALASPRDADVQLAQAYLRHRPLRDAAQLRAVAAGIVRMPASDAKVRALDALSTHYISDEEILEELARSFASSKSARVQRAIAGVLVRSDYRKPGLAALLREHRLDKPGQGGLVDVLIGRLPAS